MAATTAMPRGLDTIAECLSSDHDRLDGLLTMVCRAVETGDLEAARTTLAQFASGLSRHIRIEEEIIFPLFEMRTSGHCGPTLVMRSEHRDILAAVRTMREGLAQFDVETFREGLALLRGHLAAHNIQEEQIVYPAIEQVFSNAERTVFVERLQRELAWS